MQTLYNDSHSHLEAELCKQIPKSPSLSTSTARSTSPHGQFVDLLLANLDSIKDYTIDPHWLYQATYEALKDRYSSGCRSLRLSYSIRAHAYLDSKAHLPPSTTIEESHHLMLRQVQAVMSAFLHIKSNYNDFDLDLLLGLKREDRFGLNTNSLYLLYKEFNNPDNPLSQLYQNFQTHNLTLGHDIHGFEANQYRFLTYDPLTSTTINADFLHPELLENPNLWQEGLHYHRQQDGYLRKTEAGHKKLKQLFLSDPRPFTNLELNTLIGWINTLDPKAPLMLHVGEFADTTITDVIGALSILENYPDKNTTLTHFLNVDITDPHGKFTEKLVQQLAKTNTEITLCPECNIQLQGLAPNWAYLSYIEELINNERQRLNLSPWKGYTYGTDDFYALDPTEFRQQWKTQKQRFENDPQAIRKNSFSQFYRGECPL